MADYYDPREADTSPDPEGAILEEIRRAEVHAEPLAHYDPPARYAGEKLNDLLDAMRRSAAEFQEQQAKAEFDDAVFWMPAPANAWNRVHGAQGPGTTVHGVAASYVAQETGPTTWADELWAKAIYTAGLTEPYPGAVPTWDDLPEVARSNYRRQARRTREIIEGAA